MWTCTKVDNLSWSCLHCTYSKADTIRQCFVSLNIHPYVSPCTGVVHSCLAGKFPGGPQEYVDLIKCIWHICAEHFCSSLSVWAGIALKICVFCLSEKEPIHIHLSYAVHASGTRVMLLTCFIHIMMQNISEIRHAGRQLHQSTPFSRCDDILDPELCATIALRALGSGNGMLVMCTHVHH